MTKTLRTGGCFHISDVLDEFFKDRAREDLASIAYNGVFDVLDSGAIDEFVALIDLGYMNSGDIYKAHHDYLVNNLWKN